MKVVKKETPKEEVKFIAEEVDDLKEDVTWLAEDILGLTDVLDCIHSVEKIMLDIIIKQDEQIKDLDNKISSVDNAWLCLFWVLVIWNVILSVLLALYL